MVAEKRKYRRVNFDRTVRVGIEDGDKATFKAYDYSVAGIGLNGLLSATIPMIGDVLNLSFEISPNDQARHVAMRGEVRHIELKGGSFSMGVSFL